VVLKVILRTPLYTSIIMDCTDLCLYALYLSVVTILQSHQQCVRVLFSLEPYQNVVSHADSREVIFHCILIFISLVISDAEHLFMCLLAVAPILTTGVLSAWLLCSFDMSL